jgi:hypothetical protein
MHGTTIKIKECLSSSGTMVDKHSVLKYMLSGEIHYILRINRYTRKHGQYFSLEVHISVALNMDNLQTNNTT